MTQEQMQADNIVAARGQRLGAQADPRLNWRREAKFCLFIHWDAHGQGQNCD